MQDDSYAVAAIVNGKPARQGGFSICASPHDFTPKLLHTSLTRDMKSSTTSLGRFVSSKRMRTMPGFFVHFEAWHRPSPVYPPRPVGRGRGDASQHEVKPLVAVHRAAFPARRRTLSFSDCQSNCSTVFANSIHLRRPVFWAGPMTSISSSGRRSQR